MDVTTPIVVRSERQEHIEGIRTLLDFLWEHPEVPWPISLSHSYIFVDDKEQMRNVVKQLGNVSKFPSGEHLAVEKKFGDRTFFTVYVNREQVCHKVVTGIEHVEEKVTPAHDKEIVEWVCDDPLLKPSE